SSRNWGSQNIRSTRCCFPWRDDATARPRVPAKTIAAINHTLPGTENPRAIQQYFFNYWKLAAPGVVARRTEQHLLQILEAFGQTRPFAGEGVLGAISRARVDIGPRLGLLVRC